jgi:radical SAM protein with 4Fe4S-binding SPASM domain
MGLKEWWAEMTGARLEPGAYRYDGEGELAHHRFHLRVDSAHRGILIVDASGLVELNGTALEYARCVLEGRNERQAVKHMLRRYRHLDAPTAAAHFHQVREQLVRFVLGDTGVIEIIGADSPTIGADDFPAPYRMDVLLTYSCQNRCGHCYNEPRELKELTAEEWERVIDRLWKYGIPHVVFTGGEPTRSPHLRRLIDRAERNGQVAGLVTNGRALSRPGYLNDLIEVGLDHVQITVLSHLPEVHDRLVCSEGAWEETIKGLDTALSSDLYVNTNTTIMRSTLPHVEDTLRFLIGRGVRNVAFNGLIRSGKGKEAEGISFEEMADALLRLKGIADEAGVKMTWYTPTPYCQLNPINLDLGIKQCTACSLNMAMEPDGTVLPCQSYYEPLGNILTDDWDSIWDHELCRSIRNRDYLNGRCVDCGLRDACGGGCPLARRQGEYDIEGAGPTS